MRRLFLTLFILGVLLFSGTAKAMTVFDPTNYAENLIAAQEAVQQTAQMVEQLKTQIQQYERMLKDALSLPDFVTGDLANEISQLASFKNEIENLLSNAINGAGSGDIESILREFIKPSDSKSKPDIFAKRDSLGESEMLGYEMAKGYADATMKAIKQQVDDAENFNDRYSRVLNSGQNAEGQMQVMQAQLEMLSLIVERLGEIRQLLFAGTGMQAAQTEALVQKETRERMMNAIATGDTEFFESQLKTPPQSFNFFE